MSGAQATSPVGLSLPYENGNSSVPAGQSPATRDIIIEWMETQSRQDRFNPDVIVVNQGDTINLVFINNDTVAHDFIIGPPYNIVVNASVPGLYNDLTGQEFTTPATHNSPGVVVTGTPGIVSAAYSFVAKYPGIFEYVCSYHVAVGMIGYMVVLAHNTSNTTYPTSVNQTAPQSSTIIPVSVDAGAGVNVNLPGYTPTDITVVIGINNTVKWTNNDNMPHTVTASDGSFDSGKLNPGATFAYTFTKAGVYDYLCSYHNWMHGTVTVLTETMNMQPQEEGEFTIALNANEIYGIISLGIVGLVAIMIVAGRTKRSREQTSTT